MYSTLLYSILEFLILSIIFHLLVYFYKPKEIFFKKMDYIWLLFSALSLVSYSASHRKFLAEIEYQNIQQKTKLLLKVLDLQISFEKKYTCQQWGIPSDIGITPMLKSKAIPESCAYYSKVYSELKPPSDINFVEKYSLPPVPLDVSLYWPSQELINSLSSAKESISEEKKIKEDTEDGPLEEMLKYFTPYLLAFALSVRMTKTTGEIWLSKRKSKRG